MCRWLDTGAVDTNTCAEVLANCGYLVYTPEEAEDVRAAWQEFREALVTLLQLLDELILGRATTVVSARSGGEGREEC